ncbi:hypothetical protein ALC57_15606 [Trachymyrmex cornetzi]|uniref:Uncharacterized protein n=1 Tax=Trachymyrmex cornetzi TaxID=471704 RepID=A0A151IWK3_9HYME|nr:hypothetical protein ALC57_15606 [Trachymyrmex cornetzi]
MSFLRRSPLFSNLQLLTVFFQTIFKGWKTATSNGCKMCHHRLRRVINACLRFVYEVRWNDHITPHYRRALWLKVNVRRQYFVS